VTASKLAKELRGPLAYLADTNALADIICGSEHVAGGATKNGCRVEGEGKR
jgi:hypothetical protein